MMTKHLLFGIVTIVSSAGAYELARGQKLIAMSETQPAGEHAVPQNIPDSGRRPADMDSLPALDAHGFNGVKEIGKAELVQLLSKSRPLSQDEKANLDRGCLGLTCVYQGLGLRRWPELAPGTVAYLIRQNALNRRCPNGQKNFIFLKQGWWLGGHAPRPDRTTGEVSVESVTRMKPGFYTFNYAVYFPATETYAWMNHRDYGFPVNWIRPQKAYLSASPPPLDDNRPAQIYCSTCR
jgi:hypothetical protein